MAHASIISTKPKILTRWQIFTNNGRFNSALPPSQRNLQHRITSSVDRTGYPKYRIRACQTATDRPLSSIKTSNRISSSSSSLNNIKINQGHNIRIDLRTSSNPYIDSQVETTLSPFSEVDNTNASVTQSINSPRRQSLHLIEDVPELTRECAICLLDQPINLFEERYSDECEHFERRICDTCVYNHTKSLVENVLNSNIICPEPNCISKFSFENIRYILSMGNNFELFERYDRQLTHEHLEQIQEFVWCAHNGCGSGQLHDMGLHSNPMVTCIKCKKQTCAFHRIIWHIGMTCQEYDQSKILSIDNNTQIWLNKHSKKCPKCKSYIEKISGCDHMTCKRCKHQFCWQCFADYQKIQIHGLRQHRNSCIHYPRYHRSNNISYTQRSTTCNIL